MTVADMHYKKTKSSCADLDDDELGQDLHNRGGQPGLVGHGVHYHGHLSFTGPPKVQLHDDFVGSRSIALINLHSTDLRGVVTQIKPAVARQKDA